MGDIKGSVRSTSAPQILPWTLASAKAAATAKAATTASATTSASASAWASRLRAFIFLNLHILAESKVNSNMNG